MKKATYYGNSWIGVFMKTNNTHTLMPIDAMDKIAKPVEENLKTEAVKLLIGGSNLIGLYVAMNSNGAILPNIATNEEVAVVKKLGINVHRSNEKNNAHGNNISVNDKGGLISNVIESSERKAIADTLGVELVETSIARYHTVGSCALATNKGFLTHFSANERELEILEHAFRIRGSKGSINTGTGFVSLGVVANENGYIVGEQTTAFEMGRVEEALGFI